MITTDLPTLAPECGATLVTHPLMLERTFCRLALNTGELRFAQVRCPD
jgi:hypothetical protein